MKKIWLAIIIVLIIGLFFLVKPLLTGKTIDEDRVKMNEFAQCLTDSNLTMYGTLWCSHCQNQKKLFGKSFKYVNFIDCDRKSEICTLEKITGYPTWKINNTNYPGEQSFSRLSQLTGCVLD